MNKILRKVRKIFYLNQIKPGPRFGRLLTCDMLRVEINRKSDSKSIENRQTTSFNVNSHKWDVNLDVNSYDDFLVIGQTECFSRAKIPKPQNLY